MLVHGRSGADIPARKHGSIIITRLCSKLGSNATEISTHFSLDDAVFVRHCKQAREHCCCCYSFDGKGKRRIESAHEYSSFAPLMAVEFEFKSFGEYLRVSIAGSEALACTLVALVWGITNALLERGVKRSDAGKGTWANRTLCWSVILPYIANQVSIIINLLLFTCLTIAFAHAHL